MKLLQKALLIGTGLALATSSAMAAFTFTNGDVILGVQAAAGLGNTTNVFLNLGSSTVLRDLNGTGLQVGNINTTLTSVFGSNWYSRNDVYFGVVANLNQQPNPPTINFRQPVDGDPSRTFYVSQAAAAPGTGVLYGANMFSSGALGIGGGALQGLETNLSSANLTNGSDNTRIMVQASAPVEWNNSWTKWNPIPGGAFNTFNGGIQQTFGKLTPETYVDVQRILSTNTGATPTGVVGGGTFEYTVAIGSNGNVSIVPEVSSTLLLGAIGLGAAFQRRRRNQFA